MEGVPEEMEDATEEVEGVPKEVGGDMAKVLGAPEEVGGIRRGSPRGGRGVLPNVLGAPEEVGGISEQVEMVVAPKEDKGVRQEAEGAPEEAEGVLEPAEGPMLPSGGPEGLPSTTQGPDTEGSDTGLAEEINEEEAGVQGGGESTADPFQFPMLGLRFVFLDLVHTLLRRIYYNHQVLVRPRTGYLMLRPRAGVPEGLNTLAQLPPVQPSSGGWGEGLAAGAFTAAAASTAAAAASAAAAAAPQAAPQDPPLPPPKDLDHESAGQAEHEPPEETTCSQIEEALKDAADPQGKESLDQTPAHMAPQLLTCCSVHTGLQ
ncbi:PREDICTED: cancer/testis antigen 47B-like [Elephantulus edwardii]|uniref:cancer/testis antigen 47B-like n=1 Tax=Elephantulus edwardii TaxID=28737 RepID=UPI0003F06155|nr:PREDICTED: cancer/testis antigen 47B-like [Elephantulus edwardii]